MTGKGIETVRMDPENVSDVIRIAGENLSEAWSGETYRRQLENPADHTFIAYLDGEPAGFVSAWYVIDEIEINGIAVAEKFRRRGIAGALLERVFKELPDASACLLEVRESNTAAIALYKKTGFEKAGIRKNFYKDPTENGIIMIRRK